MGCNRGRTYSTWATLDYRSVPDARLVNVVDGYRPQEIQAAIRNTEPASMLTRLPATQQLFANAAAIAESPSGL